MVVLLFQELGILFLLFWLFCEPFFLRLFLLEMKEFFWFGCWLLKEEIEIENLRIVEKRGCSIKG